MVRVVYLLCNVIFNWHTHTTFTLEIRYDDESWKLNLAHLATVDIFKHTHTHTSY